MTTAAGNNGQQNGGGAAGAGASGDANKGAAGGATGSATGGQTQQIPPAGDQGTNKTGPLAAALGETTPGNQPPANQPPANQPPAVDYDKLDLKKPEGYKGADSDIAYARGMAKALGLSAEAAQKFVDEHAKVIAADDEAIIREQAQTRSDNIAKLKADAEFGGAKFNESIARADQALAVIDPNGELGAELKAFGLDTHPTLVRAFMRLGNMLAEGNTFVQAKPPNEEGKGASLSEFYPSMK